MSLFERKERHQEPVINIGEINVYLGEKNKSHGVHLVLTQTNKNGKFIIMALTLNANQQAAGTLGLQDNVTNLPVTGTFSGTTASPDNAAVFTAVVNADGSITATAVAPGTGNLNVSTIAAYTDSNNQPQTQTLTLSVPVTVAQPTADSVSLTLTFGTPTTVTPPATA